MSNPFPVVYVTLADRFGQPGAPFLSVEQGRTAKGNVMILDQYGYRYTTTPACVLPVLDLDGTPVLGIASIERDRLVIDVVAR
jgi:hypothetical protein